MTAPAPAQELAGEITSTDIPASPRFGMRSSELPPETPRNRLRTARAFLDALWEIRDLDAQGDLARAPLEHVRAPVQFGQLLDYAALYPGRMRARPGEIPCRDDSWRWAVTRRSPIRDDTFERTLWAIWQSLEPLERQILALERTLTHQDIADKLRREGVLTGQGREPTSRFVRRVRRQAHEKIAGHPLFKELAGAEG